jgi:hypothetical protein
MIILTRRTFQSATFSCYYSIVVENSDIEKLRSTIVDDNHEFERWIYQLMTRTRKWYHQSRQSKFFLSVVSGFADDQNQNEFENQYFTDRQYRREKSFNRRKSYRDRNDRFQNNRRLKKCFVCEKSDCWSINHSKKERENSKKRFSDRYLEYKQRSEFDRRLN